MTRITKKPDGSSVTIEQAGSVGRFNGGASEQASSNPNDAGSPNPPPKLSKKALARAQREQLRAQREEDDNADKDEDNHRTFDRPSGDKAVTFETAQDGPKMRKLNAGDIEMLVALGAISQLDDMRRMGDGRTILPTAVPAVMIRGPLGDIYLNGLVMETGLVSVTVTDAEKGTVSLKLPTPSDITSLDVATPGLRSIESSDADTYMVRMPVRRLNALPPLDICSQRGPLLQRALLGSAPNLGATLGLWSRNIPGPIPHHHAGGGAKITGQLPSLADTLAPYSGLALFYAKLKKAKTLAMVSTARALGAVTLVIGEPHGRPAGIYHDLDLIVSPYTDLQGFSRSLGDALAMMVRRGIRVLAVESFISLIRVGGDLMMTAISAFAFDLFAALDAVARREGILILAPTNLSVPDEKLGNQLSDIIKGRQAMVVEPTGVVSLESLAEITVNGQPVGPTPTEAMAAGLTAEDILIGASFEVRQGTRRSTRVSYSPFGPDELEWALKRGFFRVDKDDSTPERLLTEWAIEAKLEAALDDGDAEVSSRAQAMLQLLYTRLHSLGFSVPPLEDLARLIMRDGTDEQFPDIDREARITEVISNLSSLTLRDKDSASLQAAQGRSLEKAFSLDAQSTLDIGAFLSSTSEDKSNGAV